MFCRNKYCSLQGENLWTAQTFMKDFYAKRGYPQQTTHMRIRLHFNWT